MSSLNGTDGKDYGSVEEKALAELMHNAVVKYTAGYNNDRYLAARSSLAAATFDVEYVAGNELCDAALDLCGSPAHRGAFGKLMARTDELPELLGPVLDFLIGFCPPRA
jgi:hypothetical protein